MTGCTYNSQQKPKKKALETYDSRTIHTRPHHNGTKTMQKHLRILHIERSHFIGYNRLVSATERCRYTACIGHAEIIENDVALTKCDKAS